MRKIKFTYKDHELILDTTQGVLTGQDDAKTEIMAVINKAETHYGSGCSPIPPTRITNPMTKIEQFSICLFYELNTQFPEELRKYIPQWEKKKGFAKTKPPFMVLH